MNNFIFNKSLKDKKKIVMTTAHRPTWTPKVGSKQAGAPTKQISAKLMPSHTQLKTRQTGQNTKEEIEKRDLKQELIEKELKASENKNKGWLLFSFWK